MKGRLTRHQVAQQLGVSIASVRRMEGVKLHPIFREGVNWFDPTEVDKVRVTTGGVVVKRHKVTKLLERAASRLDDAERLLVAMVVRLERVVSGFEREEKRRKKAGKR